MKNSLKQFGAVSQGREFKWFVKCLIPLTLLCCEQSNCNAQNRTLSFPDNQTIGTLSTYPPPQESDNIPEYTKFSHSANSIGAACGNREVPEDAFIGLAIDDLDSDPNLLALIPIDGIQRLSLNRVTLSTETLQQIERIKSLMRMESLKEVHNLRTPTGDELRGLMKRSDLKRIHIDSLGKDASSGQLADLIRVNRQLESITLKNVELTSELAYSLATCPALNHLSLSVGDFDDGLFQKTQIFSMLNQLHLSILGTVQNLTVLTRIPNLSSLQISLSTRNPDDWSFIANAPALQRIDIMDGYCDDRIVGWIDQCKSLRSFLGAKTRS